MSSVTQSEEGRRLLCLMGAPLDTGNRGVSALGVSLVKLTFEACPAADVAMLVGNRTSTPCALTLGGKAHEVRVVNYRMSPKARLREQLAWIVCLALAYRFVPSRALRTAIEESCPWIAALARADFVGDIRGGDSFSDIYGLRRFLSGSIPILTVLLVRGRLALLPQTYGPYKSWLARAIARGIMRRASVILARDFASLDVVKELTRGRRVGQFCPDVAFALEPVRPAELAIEPPVGSDGGGCLIGLNVNGLMYHGGYTRSNMFGLRLDYRRFLEELVPALLADRSSRLLLVPHTFAAPERVESDPGASRELMSRLPSALLERVHLVTREYNQSEIKGIIGMCDFFIGSRMHACIGALSQGIPTIGVAYSRKFQGVFESIGVGDWVVQAQKTDQAAALHQAMGLFQRRAELRQLLADRIAGARCLLTDTFHELFRPADQR